MLIIAPAELQLRQCHTSSMHWAGIVLRRTSIARTYEAVREAASTDQSLFATDVDQDRFVVSRQIIRGVVQRDTKRDHADVVFRFPFGLALLFSVFSIGSVTVTFNCPINDIGDFFGVGFFICFMCGLALGMWSILHHFAIQEAEDIFARLNGVSTAPNDYGEPSDEPKSPN